MNKQEIDKLIEMFCSKNMEVIPVYNEQKEKILNRMLSIGLVTSREVNNYFGKENQ